MWLKKRIKKTVYKITELRSLKHYSKEGALLSQNCSFIINKRIVYINWILYTKKYKTQIFCDMIISILSCEIC